ncbi:hypothetical protein HDU93_003100 [Gonapodya sp. JEL0774]|nr:hypothetical protein HDU93_003100 [Gonapodya sp. JEL0774]
MSQPVSLEPHKSEIVMESNTPTSQQKAEVTETEMDIYEDSKADKSQAPIEYTPLTFTLLFVGLALIVFLAALDQTILSVALHFQTFSGTSWVFTAYLLTATAFIPLYGKSADIFGRKPVILAAVVIFELGSAICGAATSMNMLIIGRAVAGLGGGGILSLVIVIISGALSFGDSYINLPIGAATLLVVILVLKLPVRVGRPCPIHHVV